MNDSHFHEDHMKPIKRRFRILFRVACYIIFEKGNSNYYCIYRYDGKLYYQADWKPILSQ